MLPFASFRDAINKSRLENTTHSLQKKKKEVEDEHEKMLINGNDFLKSCSCGHRFEIEPG